MATSTITVEGMHGFSGTVNLSCALVPASSTAEITCGFTSPTTGPTTSVTVSGSAASTATLSIVTVAPHGISKPSANARPRNQFGWWLASGGALFAGIFIGGVPRRRWHWAAMPMLVCFALLATGIGCGGGSSGGGGGGGTTPTAATPTFTPASGTYTGSVSVTVSDATAGTNLYCTTDGSTPTTSSPTCAAMNLTATTTIKAIAVGSGYNNSGVASGTYTITAATPTFSPAPGTYTASVSVTVSDATAGALLHCTTDGSTPTASSPACAAMNLTATTTVKAIAVASGYNNSLVASGTYTILHPGTPSGSYVVQVTATSGNITHTTNVPFAVQ